MNALHTVMLNTFFIKIKYILPFFSSLEKLVEFEIFPFEREFPKTTNPKNKNK